MKRTQPLFFVMILATTPLLTGAHACGGNTLCDRASDRLSECLGTPAHDVDFQCEYHTLCQAMCVEVASCEELKAADAGDVAGSEPFLLCISKCATNH